MCVFQGSQSFSSIVNSTRSDDDHGTSSREQDDSDEDMTSNPDQHLYLPPAYQSTIKRGKSNSGDDSSGSDRINIDEEDQVPFPPKPQQAYPIHSTPQPARRKPADFQRLVDDLEDMEIDIPSQAAGASRKGEPAEREHKGRLNLIRTFIFSAYLDSLVFPTSSQSSSQQSSQQSSSQSSVVQSSQASSRASQLLSMRKSFFSNIQRCRSMFSIRSENAIIPTGRLGLSSRRRGSTNKAEVPAAPNSKVEQVRQATTHAAGRGRYSK